MTVETRPHPGFMIMRAEKGKLSHKNGFPDNILDFISGAPHSVVKYVNGFAVITPDAPYVPVSGGSHFMLAPISRRNHDIGDLTPDEAKALSAVMLTHLAQSPNHIAGINIGKENEILRRDTNRAEIDKMTPRTMVYLHLHLLELPDSFVKYDTRHEVRRKISGVDELEQNELVDELENEEQEVDPAQIELAQKSKKVINFYRHKLNEPYEVLIETILRKTIRPNPNFRVIGPGEVRGSGKFVHLPGALDFVIPENCSPEELSEFLRNLDSQYRTLHRSIFGSAISNYDQLAETEFNGDLELNPEPVLPDLGLDEKSEAKLQHIVKSSVEVDVKSLSAQRQFFRAPSYSLGIGDGVITFVPHINTGRGAIEALGIVAMRVPGDPIENDPRRERNKIAGLETIAHAAEQYPDIFKRRMETILPDLGLHVASLTLTAIVKIATGNELLSDEELPENGDLEAIKRIVLNEPTEIYLYPGVEQFFRHVSQSGNIARIWTEGEPEYQRKKVESSGIDLETFNPYIAKDKIALIPELLDEALGVAEDEIEEIVIMDDKFSKLKGAQEKIDELKNEGKVRKDIRVRILRVIHDPKTYKLNPTEEEQRFIETYTIEEVKSIQQADQLLFGDDDKPKPKVPRLIISDFDRTLVNTQYYLMGVGRSIDAFIDNRELVGSSS